MAFCWHQEDRQWPRWCESDADKWMIWDKASAKLTWVALWASLVQWGRPAVSFITQLWHLSSDTRSSRFGSCHQSNVGFELDALRERENKGKTDHLPSTPEFAPPRSILQVKWPCPLLCWRQVGTWAILAPTKQGCALLWGAAAELPSSWKHFEELSFT